MSRYYSNYSDSNSVFNAEYTAVKFISYQTAKSSPNASFPKILPSK